MDYTDNPRLDQAIAMAVERARFALSLAASQDRPVTVVVSYSDGEVAVGIDLQPDL